MRRLQAAAAVFVLSSVVLALAGPDVSLDPTAVERLVEDSGGAAQVTLHPATGAARFVHLQSGRLALDGADNSERAQEFLRRYGSAFGIEDPAAELYEFEGVGTTLR